MEYSVSSKNPAQVRTDCLVVATGSKGGALPEGLPDATRKQIQGLVRSGDFAGRKLQTLVVHEPEGLAARRLLLVGTGNGEPLEIPAFLRLARKVATAVAETGAASAAWVLDNVAVRDRDMTWKVRESTRALEEALYRFDEYRTEKQPAPRLKKWTLVSGEGSRGLKKAQAEGMAVARGMALARDLGNQPGNVCHPEYLTDRAREMEKQYPGLTVKVITEKQAEKMGMGAFCSVSRGSERDGRIIVFQWKKGRGAPLALVGKAITFDTGGISIKPGASMDEMKFDMCGGASVFGAVKTVCELDLPINLVGVVAAAENMPDGRATRPGDIVHTLSGQTVEILNTDAEGRMVLCDALTWVQQKHKPKAIVDIATLTGACVVALGAHAQAVYANDEGLSQALLDAGEHTGDRGWPMPLWEEYQEQLKSPVADMAHIGGPKAGSITAACFLSRFTKKSRWAHLDIAGTAWTSGSDKGATGRPVPMLTRWLLSEAGRK